MLKFAEMPDTVLQNFKGGDGEVSARMFQDDKVRIMRLLDRPAHPRYRLRGGLRAFRPG